VKLMFGTVVCGAAIGLATILPIFANPSPPTNGGNGSRPERPMHRCCGPTGRIPAEPNGAGSQGNGG